MVTKSRRRVAYKHQLEAGTIVRTDYTEICRTKYSSENRKRGGTGSTLPLLLIKWLLEVSFLSSSATINKRKDPLPWKKENGETTVRKARNNRTKKQKPNGTLPLSGAKLDFTVQTKSEVYKWHADTVAIWDVDAPHQNRSRPISRRCIDITICRQGYNKHGWVGVNKEAFPWEYIYCALG